MITIINSKSILLYYLDITQFFVFLKELLNLFVPYFSQLLLYLLGDETGL